jgi:hypothetical protein
VIRRDQQVARGRVLAQRAGRDADGEVALRVGEDRDDRLPADPAHGPGPTVGAEHEVADRERLDRPLARRRRDAGAAEEAGGEGGGIGRDGVAVVVGGVGEQKGDAADDADPAALEEAHVFETDSGGTRADDDYDVAILERRVAFCVDAIVGAGPVQTRNGEVRIGSTQHISVHSNESSHACSSPR